MLKLDAVATLPLSCDSRVVYNDIFFARSEPNRNASVIVTVRRVDRIDAVLSTFELRKGAKLRGRTRRDAHHAFWNFFPHEPLDERP